MIVDRGISYDNTNHMFDISIFSFIIREVIRCCYWYFIKHESMIGRFANIHSIHKKFLSLY